MNLDGESLFSHDDCFVLVIDLKTHNQDANEDREGRRNAGRLPAENNPGALRNIIGRIISSPRPEASFSRGKSVLLELFWKHFSWGINPISKQTRKLIFRAGENLCRTRRSFFSLMTTRTT